ncbi:MAG: hypothetical protein EXS10_10230 [Phycisphaerales bacterium]|nr:hypothetical protein [Phycisphaerales bacterium]
MGCLGSIIRVPLGVILGCAAMMLIVMVSFAVAFLALGVESVYKPESWEPSQLGLGIDLAVWLVAGFTGGAVATMVGRRRAGLLLAFSFALVSISFAVFGWNSMQDRTNRPALPPKDMAFMDGGNWTEMPEWIPWAHGGLGFISVIIGTMAAGRRPKDD